jgi:pantothenate synthetase
MRRVQSLRKKQGLAKSDRIELVIAAEAKIGQSLAEYKQQIGEKVGAGKIMIVDIADNIDNTSDTKSGATADSDNLRGKYAASSEEQVKGKRFGLYFNIVHHSI